MTSYTTAFTPSVPPQKKIVILKNQLVSLGGLEKSTFRIAKALSKAGCDVCLLTASDMQHTPLYLHKTQGWDYEVVNLGLPPKMSFLRLQYFDDRCQEWLKSHPADIVLGMDRNSFQTHYRAGNGVHAEYLAIRSKKASFLKRWSFKINPLHRLILRFERQTYEHPDLRVLFANSYMVANDIQKHYQVDKRKIQVIHNGVEWEEMAPEFMEWESKKEEHTKALGLDPRAFQFLFAGNGYERKGLEYLLKALAPLSKEHFQLSVIGKESKIGKFLTLTERLGLAHKVRFFGKRYDCRSFYQIADCVVIPSIYDPFANVTLEALAMGVPVISSRHNGGHEVLTSANGRILEDLEDSHAFTEALKKALDHPKTLSGSAAIRESVKSHDNHPQLQKMIKAILDSSYAS